MRVKTCFRLTPKVLYLNIEGCRSVIIKRSISVTGQQHFKWSGVELFNRARCTTLFARRFNHTLTRPVTSLQAHYPSPCFNDLLVYFISIQKILLWMSSPHISSSVRTCLKIFIGFAVEWRQLLGFLQMHDLFNKPDTHLSDIYYTCKFKLYISCSEKHLKRWPLKQYLHLPRIASLFSN